MAAMARMCIDAMVRGLGRCEREGEDAGQTVGFPYAARVPQSFPFSNIKRSQRVNGRDLGWGWGWECRKVKSKECVSMVQCFEFLNVCRDICNKVRITVGIKV